MDGWDGGREEDHMAHGINTTTESFKRFLHFGKCEQGSDCDVTKGTADDHPPSSSLQPPGQVAFLSPKAASFRSHDRYESRDAKNILFNVFDRRP